MLWIARSIGLHPLLFGEAFSQPTVQKPKSAEMTHRFVLLPASGGARPFPAAAGTDHNSILIIPQTG
jgi:hypothetical protein